MRKKLFLLPGFGEDSFCFRELSQYLKNYELIPIDYRPVLHKFSFPVISRKQFCRQLITQYNIQENDKLIGHSMGGYFSFQIREIIGNDICMIASFNDPGKLIHIIPQFPRATQIAALSGLLKTNILKNYLLNKIKDARYKDVQISVMDNFKNFSNTQLGLMMEMNMEECIPSNLPNPLRIHDKKDRVVAAPDQDYIQVNGGHFCLNLHAEETYLAMQDFLN